MSLDNPQIASALIGMLIPLIGALAVWPMYALGKRVVGSPAALIAAACSREAPQAPSATQAKGGSSSALVAGASLSISPAPLRFDKVVVWGAQTLTLTNTGAAPITVQSVAFCAATSPEFTLTPIASPGSPVTIAPGASVRLRQPIDSPQSGPAVTPVHELVAEAETQLGVARAPEVPRRADHDFPGFEGMRRIASR